MGHLAHWVRVVTAGYTPRLKRASPTQVLKPAKRYEHLTGLKSEKLQAFLAF
ncbi:hypothetical protein [Slackia isoflavoniconvertens]|uniref:hypothetical protein n=1 Tax=Slackia isoflavoniconvertens TaxID=572010 RepID=UPI003F964A77